MLRRLDLAPKVKLETIRNLHEAIALNEGIELKIRAAAGPVGA